MVHDKLHVVEEASAITRRDFLKGAVAVTVGAGLALSSSDSQVDAAVETAPKLATRVLGRTKLKVTVVSFGGLQIQNRAILDMAIDRGINLIHTSPGYGRGRSIQIFGEVMKTKREKVYLALKLAPTDNIDRWLKVLNTDYVDILVPPAHNVRAVRNPRWQEAYERLKKAGKVRFAGFACHNNIPAVMEAAIKLGYFDVMLVAYNMANRAQIDPILKRAKQKGIGFMAMKVTRGLNRRQPKLFIAGLKGLLTNKDVDTLLIGMASFNDVQLNLQVASGQLTKAEAQLLEQHLATVALACSMCGACDICPRGVSVADIMRCYEYAERGEVELAAEVYRTLPPDGTALNCTDCGKCEAACPKGIPVVKRIYEVHKMVT